MPPFVSWYRTFQRIVEAQRSARVTNEASPMLGFIFFVIAVFFLPIEVVYAELFRRLPDISAVDPETAPAKAPSAFIAGVSHLPARFTAVDPSS